MKRYTETHDWIEEVNQVATIGIRQEAVHELGEVVYVELPKIGSVVKKGQEIVVLESTKAAIDLHSPLDGTVLEVNDKLANQPQLINTASETEAWLYKLTITPTA
jgi:glycine cleavage system H protein